MDNTANSFGDTSGRANSGGANFHIGKNANREIGDPSGDPSEPSNESRASYWHSRGYLPHFESPDKIQHVTFHLGDSLPQSALERMAQELKHLPPDKQGVERRQRIEAWLDAGYGSCILRKPEIAAMVQNALLFFDGERYRMFEWCVMPNHVHTLFQPLNGWTVAKIAASWKKFTARKIALYCANVCANVEIGDPRIDAKENEPIWHREYFDRFIRDERHFENAVNYVRQNPVKAGLVKQAEDWIWSSAYQRHSSEGTNPETHNTGTSSA